MGRIAAEMGEINQARILFDAAEQLLKDAATEGESAAIYALWADTKAQILLIRGISYVIRNSGKIRRLAQTALEIDPDNALARLVIARGKINAPRLFGGSVPKGIEMVRSVLDLDGLEPFELFLAHYSLAVASEKEGEFVLAADHLSEALELYPKNPDGLDLLDRLASGVQ